MDFWKLEQAEQINKSIKTLPTAILKPIFDENGEPIEGFKATYVGDEVIDVPTYQYVLKQHEETFRPIITGLTVSGVKKFDFCLWSDKKKAKLAILIGEADDTVKFGFTVANSFDRSSSINYGFKAKKSEQVLEIIQREHVLVWGFRQVCSNGLVIKVPLKTCKYMDTQLVTRVRELLVQKVSIIHKGKNVDQKIQDMQFITEAFLLLKNPISEMIKDAKLIYLEGTQAEQIIRKYVGKRRLEWYLQHFTQEEQTLWGLYNSITYISSHDKNMRNGERESLLNRAANLLENELMPEVKTK